MHDLYDAARPDDWIRGPGSDPLSAVARPSRRPGLPSLVPVLLFLLTPVFGLFDAMQEGTATALTGRAGTAVGPDTLLADSLAQADSLAAAERRPAVESLEATLAAPEREGAVEEAPAETEVFAVVGEAGAGQASYYGKELAGQPTASGEPFDPSGLTAAHPTLPLGSRVRVTNTRNGRTVVVRINDRGPFSRSRVIDLSYAAAKHLGMIASGTAHVRIDLVR